MVAGISPVATPAKKRDNSRPTIAERQPAMDDPLIKLKPKVEHFARLVANGATGLRAYQVAFNNPNPTTARTLSQRIMAKPGVLERIEQILRHVEAMRHVTKDWISLKTLAIAEEAREAGDFAAALTGYRDVAKLHGMLVDRSELAIGIVSKPLAIPTNEIELSVEDWTRMYNHPQIEHIKTPTKNGNGTGH